MFGLGVDWFETCRAKNRSSGPFTADSALVTFNFGRFGGLTSSLSILSSENGELERFAWPASSDFLGDKRMSSSMSGWVSTHTDAFKFSDGPASCASKSSTFERGLLLFRFTFRIARFASFRGDRPNETSNSAICSCDRVRLFAFMLCGFKKGFIFCDVVFVDITSQRRKRALLWMSFTVVIEEERDNTNGSLFVVASESGVGSSDARAPTRQLRNHATILGIVSKE